MQKNLETEKNVAVTNQGNVIGHATICCCAQGPANYQLVWIPDKDLSKALLTAKDNDLIDITILEFAERRDNYESILTTIKRAKCYFCADNKAPFTELGKIQKLSIRCNCGPNADPKQIEEDLFIKEEYFDSCLAYADLLVGYSQHDLDLQDTPENEFIKRFKRRSLSTEEDAK